jgi:hypothetical protein
MLPRWAFPLFAFLFLVLLAHRVWRSADRGGDGHGASMPTKVEDAEERELYLTPGGKYTRADIEANGHTTPSRQYRDFRASHDFNPRRGDVLCPITRTKAHPDCTWIIAGKRYAFCCPPCIDEFVKMAKEQPEKVEPPERFVKR